MKNLPIPTNARCALLILAALSCVALRLCLTSDSDLLAVNVAAADL